MTYGHYDNKKGVCALKCGCRDSKNLSRLVNHKNIARVQRGKIHKNHLNISRGLLTHYNSCRFFESSPTVFRASSSRASKHQA